MSNLEILEDLLEKYHDPEKQIYDLELEILKSNYSYHINIFYFIQYLSIQQLREFLHRDIPYVEKNSKFSFGRNYGMLRDRGIENNFRPILFNGDVIEMRCHNIFKNITFKIDSHTWFDHICAIIKILDCIILF